FTYGLDRPIECDHKFSALVIKAASWSHERNSFTEWIETAAERTTSPCEPLA
uniref:Uncharacterized protein n=1 Tax=Aegilops tauschii subsp. strangulata TaxID=200361 RepID=A0A453L6N9_AEGTS